MEPAHEYKYLIIQSLVSDFDPDEFMGTGPNERPSCTLCCKEFLQKSDVKRHILGNCTSHLHYWRGKEYYPLDFFAQIRISIKTLGRRQQGRRRIYIRHRRISAARSIPTICLHSQRLCPDIVKKTSNLLNPTGTV